MKSKKLIITIVTVAMVLLVLVGCDTIEKADYVLTIDIEGEGGSVVSPGEGAYVYEYGEDVPIIVDIYEGFELVEWTGPDGDKVEKDGNNYKIKINGNMEICAVFAEKSAADDSLVFYDFEDGEIGDWKQFGGVSLVIASRGHESERSLFASKRNADYAGPAIELKDELKNGEEYFFQLWVYQDSGTEKHIKMSIKIVDDDGEDYGQIAENEEVPSGEWVELKNEAHLIEYEGEAEEISVYIEASDADLDFYIDDFLVK